MGYATEDTDVSLLDEDGKDVQFGAVGEIVVESRYISPGYWRRPDLTREKFFSDPNGGDKLIFHTGDLGRLRSDGLLYHLGRKDFQLNIRGYRVEAGEIETVLLAQDNVKEAIVATGKTSTGAESDRLIAYIVPFSKPLSSIPVLRRAVGTKLPAHMIPSDFVFLESLPVTSNGKVDRRALPAPGNARPELDMTYVIPQSDIEEQLARIWEEVLDVRPIGIHDNFFDLGGHSLSATRLVSQIIKHFQLEIPLQSLLQSPTVAKMAAAITEHQERKLKDKDGRFAAGTALSLRPLPRDPKLELSFAQQRLWFLNQLEPDSPVYNQCKALRLRGRLNRPALQQALGSIVERHEVLRTTYAMVDGGIAEQIIGTVQPVELPILDISSLAESQLDDEVQRIAEKLKERPFDLRKDMPLRLALIKLSPRAYVLVTIKHHIASDGWSSGVFSRELAALYESFTQGRLNSLPDLPIQYADYAVWQREWLQGEVLEKQLAYWKGHLQNVPVLELPADRPRAALQSDRGARQFFNLSKTLSDRLKALSHREGATLFMTLLAAFQTLLQRYSGQDDIAVGSPIAGRTRAETEGLIGFFVNTLVFRTDLSGNPTFRELLARVRESALRAYEHQDLPFEKLVEDLNPDRNSSHSPVFQVLFAVQNLPRREFEIQELIATPIEIRSVSSKFDMFAAFLERDGQLMLRMAYRSELFDATTIARMLGHFQTLLEGIVANPDQRISELPLLTETEKHQILVEWNDTKREYPKDKCIHQLFEKQVEKSPDAVAVVFEEQQLSYQELNRRANQLAHYLRRRGVGAGNFCGSVCGAVHRNGCRCARRSQSRRRLRAHGP